jgi:hypothetical protein
MGGMEKTTVYLTAAQKAALARAAAAEGRSEARLIRAGIDVVTARHRAAEAPAVVDASGERGAGSADALATPTAGRPRWLPRDVFVTSVLRHQADPGLTGELRNLAPDTTDDARIP